MNPTTQTRKWAREMRVLIDRAIEVRGNDTFLIEISNKLLELEESGESRGLMRDYKGDLI